MIKKTYIPGKPRNPKLGTATGTSGVGKTEFNQVAGSSHEHYNKGVLDQITEAMLVGALSDLITSTDTDAELTDENALSSLRVLLEIAKNNETFLEDLKEQFLSKINPDTAQKLITFIEGVEVGTFTTGALGSGAAVKMIDGTSYAEVDNLTVRQKATFRELIIESLKHIGGQLVLTPARMKCVRVVDGGTYYKCYFDTGDGEVSNEFVAGDFARCQVFTGSGTKFYWRLVTLVGEDWINISKTSAAVGSDAPEAGDDITQLGNATDTTRQSAIILSTVGIDAPSWKQYSGINSFSLEGKDTTVFSKLGNRISGETVFTSGGANLDDYLDGVAQDILDALQAAQDAEDKAQQAIEDAATSVTDYNAKFAEIQAQVDGEISNYSYPYTPTLLNYPTSDWATDIEKDRHIGDVFHNSQAFVDNETTPDSGKAWRFVKNGTAYSWTPIADSDAVKAIQEASKAQAMADGKSTTYLIQPAKYKLGDMWVLNADQTVNGTLYKQGELLTATQDSETFIQSHWLKRIRYTDDTKANQALSSLTNFTDTVFPQEKNQLQSQIDDKIESHFTATDPATAWTTADLKTKHTGDMWYNTTTKKLNRYSGSGWSLVEDQKAIDAFNTASTAKDTADGKRRVFTTTPTVPYDVGDLWAQGTSGDLMRCATAKTSAQTYNVADWVKASKYTDDTAVDNLEIGGRNLFILNQSLWERGSISSINGSNESGNSRVRTIDFLPMGSNQNYYLSIHSEHNVGIFAYDEDDNYLGFLGSSVWQTQSSILQSPTGTAKLKMIIAKKDNTNITLDELKNVIVKLEKGNKATDWTPAPEDVDAAIDAIEIGGRNLILNSLNRIGFLSNITPTFPIQDQAVSGENYRRFRRAYPAGVTGTEITTFTPEFFTPEKSGYYTYSTYFRPNGFDIELRLSFGGTFGKYALCKANEWTQVSVTAYIEAGVATRLAGVWGLMPPESVQWVDYNRVSVTSGNKATDWTEAPEDVDKKISDVDAKAQALEYLKLAIGQDAVINGALYTLVTILLKEDMNAAVTAGVSGIQGAMKDHPAFWAGGTDVQAQQGTAKAIIRHDGSSKFEETQVSGSIIAKQGSSGMQTWLDSSGIRVFNDTGQMNILFGMKNGYAVLEYYDNAGTFLYDLGPNGLMKMEIREEKWTVFNRISLGTNISLIVGSANRDKYKYSWNQLETTYYAYTSKIVAGINQDPTNDGAIFTSMDKTGAKMPLGFYCRKMPLNKNMIYKVATGTNQIINSQLPYFQTGNEDVYDRNNICYMVLEYYVNGKRSQTNYSAYWNETPEGYPEI